MPRRVPNTSKIRSKSKSAPAVRQSRRIANNLLPSSVPNASVRPPIPDTPRKRRAPTPARKSASGSTTTQSGKLSTADIRDQTVTGLALQYVPDQWQLQLIQMVDGGSDAGCDSVLLAGTGYGKSYIFEALALLAKSKNKVVLVICPLKTLEYDQVRNLLCRPFLPILTLN